MVIAHHTAPHTAHRTQPHSARAVQAPRSTQHASKTAGRRMRKGRALLPALDRSHGGWGVISRRGCIFPAAALFHQPRGTHTYVGYPPKRQTPCLKAHSSTSRLADAPHWAYPRPSPSPTPAGPPRDRGHHSNGAAVLLASRSFSSISIPWCGRKKHALRNGMLIKAAAITTA